MQLDEKCHFTSALPGVAQVEAPLDADSETPLAADAVPPADAAPEQGAAPKLKRTKSAVASEVGYTEHRAERPS